MSFRYEFKSGARFCINAQQAGETIELLRQRANGSLTPAMVVDAARPDTSVLHRAFEWDDSIAAERHREAQARQLVGAIVVKVAPRGVSEPKRAFVSVERPDVGLGYEARHVVLGEKELRGQVIRQGWTDLEVWLSKYGEFAEFSAVTEAIAAARR
jgi:hypothetical protein